MTGSIEHGALRQIFLAPVSDPTDKTPFLIRDDAYSQKEASFGRTIRLGDPVDLGAFGTWRQTNWSGGEDQETWKDPAMFELSSADVSERRGAAKLWNGFTGIYGGGSKGGSWDIVTPGAVGLGDNSPLIWAERNVKPGTYAPASWLMFKYTPGTGTALAQTFNSEVQSMGLVGDSSGGSLGHVLVGLASGVVWRWDQVPNTWTSEVDYPEGIGYNAIVAFNNATYIMVGPHLVKRVAGVYSTVTTVSEIYGSTGMTVWNNRLWFMGTMSQGRTGVFVSDGYTVQLAFVVPGNFYGNNIVPHYGSLYIRGIINHYGSTNDTRQQVYRYNGSSLSLLWEDDSGDYDFWATGGMCSWGRHLVWSKHGTTKLGRNPGVWLYDAEEDAIFQGPTIKMDPASPGVQVSSICAWNNTLAVAFLDKGSYTAGTNEWGKWIAYLDRSERPRAIKLDGTSAVDVDKVKDTIGTVVPANFNSVGFGYPSTVKEQAILSSSYDADLPGEKKVWVKGYIRARIPVNTEVRLALLHDDSPTEHPIKTVSYDAALGSGWRDIEFKATCNTHSIYERSSKVRYKLYLKNLDWTTSPNNSPEVDVVGLDFLPSPTRRSQYHIRILAVDEQTTLDGELNDLTTRDAIVAKLKTYWNAAVPLLFWEPQADGSIPTTTGKAVIIQDFLDQSFRLDTAGTEVASEVSFNLLEVAT